MEETPEGPEIHSVHIGKAYADMEQIRAEALDALKTSECFYVFALDKERTRAESHSCVLHEQEFVPFFAFGAVRAVENLSKILQLDIDETLGYIRDIINKD